MPASVASGSQTATIDTEHTLTTQTTAAVYVLAVDLNNLVSGDVVTLKIYTKVKSDSSSVLAYYQSFSGVQADPAKYSVPVPIDTQIVCTLKQSAGTGRAFPWNLLKM